MQFVCSDHPQKTAIKYDEQSFTFDQLQKEIRHLSRQFKKLPKGILILQARPDMEFIVQLLTALTSGQPVALFTHLLSEEERHKRIALLGLAMTIDNKGNLLELYENNPVNYHPELSLILFTSGTTGQVKAVQLSHVNIESNCLAVINSLGFSNIEDQLLFLPLSYSFGLLGQLLPALKAGLTTHLLSQFTDIKMLMEKGDVPQMWSGVPSHWVAINKMARIYPQSAAKILKIISAGAPLSLTLRAELKSNFPNALIYNNYGLTEASPRVLTYSSNDSLFMESYAGYPIGDWQIRLSEDNELLIHGSQIMLGYLGEKNDSRIQNGWLSTGDIAEILPSGLVAIKGRRDTMVNIGGEKVNLAEIEHQLCQLEEINEVVLIPVESELYGVRLIACMETAMRLEGEFEQKLTEKIQRHLLPKKLPIAVRVFDKLPRNLHGKLDRTLLITQCRAK